MRTYLVSYDLAKPTYNQHVIAQTIMGLGEKWARPLSTTWYVVTDREPEAIEAEIRYLLDTDDGLLIQSVKREALLTNTALRWFRKRRAGLDIPEGSNVIAFPAPKDGETAEPELPFAEAC